MLKRKSDSVSLAPIALGVVIGSFVASVSIGIVAAVIEMRAKSDGDLVELLNLVETEQAKIMMNQIARVKTPNGKSVEECVTKALVAKCEVFINGERRVLIIEESK